MINYEVKGNLFSAELLENLNDKMGQTETDFGFVNGQRLSDEITRIFAMSRNQWHNYRQEIERLDDRKTGVSETRKLWMIPFFSFLGYDDLQFEHQEKIEEAAFNISHRELGKDGFPVHISGFRQILDQGKGLGQINRYAPHVQMQEYLNRTEHLYGIITNGSRIRLLRDHHRLTGIQYLEWDLDRMMEDNDLASFSMLFRMLHISRIPEKQGIDCLLENYHQRSVEDGHRIREKLKSAVNDSLLIVGNGFLKHPQNEYLRQLIATERLSEVEYGQLLRRLVYRLLFLFVAEDRQLLFEEGADLGKRKIYQEHYSLNRFREMAAKYHRVNPRHTDLWEQLKSTFSFFEKENGTALGLSPMGGDLFRDNALEILTSSKLSNRFFLKVIDLLSHFNPKEGQRIRINYRRINVEEFGAVYESLLDLNPTIDLNCTSTPFAYLNGESRKSTGAYYTHSDLVKQLISSTIDPLLKEQRKLAEQAHKTVEDQKKQMEVALLGLKVCDPACGSGHFLLGAARTLGTELAYIRAEEGETIDQYEKQALRDVIEQCIYGVDINPDAIELCRLVLWIEAYVPGKPITYLDHKIKCGNSLVGWLGKEDDKLIIPKGAFKAIQGDDSKTSLLFKQQNAEETKGNPQLFDLKIGRAEPQQNDRKHILFNEMSINSQEDLWQKRRLHQEWEDTEEVIQKRKTYNAWTYSFFQGYQSEESTVVSQSVLEQVENDELDQEDPLMEQVQKVAKQIGFFHWSLEFPDVFGRAVGRNGFDVVLGNPPWERIKLQEIEFFASRSKAIAEAPNASKRKQLIAKLDKESSLYREYLAAKRLADTSSKFLRESGNFPMCGNGDVNTYSIFSELVLKLVSSKGKIGIIIPTGIATENANRHFFNYLIDENRLISLYDFTNKNRLFPQVASQLRFSILSISGSSLSDTFRVKFGFFFSEVNQIKEGLRTYFLTKSDFNLINPNTQTCPSFKSRIDAEINEKVYLKFPILNNEVTNKNPWNISFASIFHMASHSGLFREKEILINNGGKLIGNKIKDDFNQIWLPLYEAKLIWLYNHRLSSFETNANNILACDYSNEQDLKQQNYLSVPRYWVREEDVNVRLDSISQSKKNGISNESIKKWFLTYRDITSSTNERSCICSIINYSAVGNTLPLIIPSVSTLNSCIIFSMFSSLIYDYLSRQKIVGVHLSYVYMKQLPVIPPEQFTEKDMQFIVPRVLELTYTAWDLKTFADDVWQEADGILRQVIQDRWKYNHNRISYTPSVKPDWVEGQEGEFTLTPFKWDTQYRMTVQSELDAYFAYKYQLEEEELKYILDPELSALAGKDFPGETFRVLKEKETKKYGEYRTAHLVLKSWNEKPWENPLAKRELPKLQIQHKRRFRASGQMHNIMGRIIAKHTEKPKYANRLGRTKMEKLLHGIETIAVLDLGRQAVKDEFGPADFEFLTQAERNAADLGYFKTVKEQIGNSGKKNKNYRFSYIKAEEFEILAGHFEANFTKYQREKIDAFIELFLPFGSTETEIPITVFAAWNNLLLQKVDITNDTQIIFAAREGWHESKKKHTPEVFQEAIDWLRENELVPRGTGKLVGELI